MFLCRFWRVRSIFLIIRSRVSAPEVFDIRVFFLRVDGGCFFDGGSQSSIKVQVYLHVFTNCTNFASTTSTTLLVGATVVWSALVRSPSPSLCDLTRHGHPSHASAPLRYSFGPLFLLVAQARGSSKKATKIQREANMHSSTLPRRMS